ncbi:signal transduction histidine kinase [Mucilaginibacter yixingensis]|uniref:histidine kinase n=1 Tax=Mucilaginibacter yixingensis TaxID=1295612 RepID=A0A2T5JFC9_9SPHI|nr:HAMP domain-containing sensor histidine kinase [Mucilaginibacter yixingensis]PTR01137.1 signal transduction histidine kinase [Mucilaginibacter yixingensis]
MKIKNRLAIYFTLLSSALLLVVMVLMYFAFSYFFRTDFYEHLHDRAKVAAQLYLEADEISSDSLNHVRERMLEKLPNEVIRIYSDDNRASFIKDESQYWDSKVINHVRRNHDLSFNEGNRQTVGLFYPDNQGNFVILTSAVDTQGHARLVDIIQVMAVVFVLINSVLFFIGRWFAQEALLPIVRLADEMKRISASQLNFRADEGNGKDEISSLAQSFNRLLEHLQNSFELQQTFVANASHELRTPLTSITGEIEVALHKKRSTEDYEALLSSILADAGRLTETVTGLMELAQTDMEYTQARTEPIRVDDLLWELQGHWSHKPLKVDMALLPDDEQALVINANASLLKIAFNNIIGNAFKFSEGKPVSCTLRADDKQMVIAIKDQGIGIPEDELVKISTPFYRGTNGRSLPGNGVGLYVTFKIFQLFNGRVDVESTVNKGTIFFITFTPQF